MIGEDGVWIAWGIAQHSHDLDFQIKCLKLLENTLNTNEPEAILYAELYDRILKRTNQKQKFGQAIIKENAIKKFYSIENETEVDKRRKAIGLEPLRVYANENCVEYKNKE
ncbi:DUF6624 domain-containing protein [uncultured Maribacter sp.]|uniref:DUF6624 domain-containing protein n=1 Tax=uncultured Maribacter sp. TaxID=431308 RepID=UPI002623BC9F|nr:DUF6624 domain-containing protein [uncultured Maribacter sp.]